MIQEWQIRVTPAVAFTEDSIKAYVAKTHGIDVRTIQQVRVLRRSIDARQRQIFVNLKVRVYINEFPQDEPFARVDYPDVSGKSSVVVVGAGPGGLFAALRLIELGLRPIVLERGKNVRDRKKDLALITRVELEPTAMASSTRAAKSAAAWRKFCKCFVSTAPQKPFSRMCTRILAPTSCHA